MLNLSVLSHNLHLMGGKGWQKSSDVEFQFQSNVSCNKGCFFVLMLYKMRIERKEVSSGKLASARKKSIHSKGETK